MLQVSTLLILLMIPIGKHPKIILLSLLSVMSYKTILITRRLLEIVVGIARGNAQFIYKKMVNSIFRENFRFRHNFWRIPTEPTIFVATYPTSPIEYLAPALMPIPVCLIASQRAKGYMGRVYSESECGYLPDREDRYSMTKTKIKEKLKLMSVFMYVEDMSRSYGRYGRNVGRLRKGAFWIAKELGVTVTPIVLDNVVDWGMIPQQKYEVYIGPTMYVDDPLSTLIKVRTMMREKKTLFAANKFKPNNLHRYP